MLLCTFSKFYTYLLKILCKFVCISCVCGFLSICLCVVAGQKIDQAEGPETFVTLLGLTKDY